MIGAFVAFGVDPAAAIVAVLAYRFFAFWLPIAPGAISFASLRRTVAQLGGRGRRRDRRAGQAQARAPRTGRRSLCHQYS